MTTFFIILGILAFLLVLWLAIKFEFLGTILEIALNILVLILDILGGRDNSSSGNKTSKGSGFGKGDSQGSGANDSF